MTDTDLSFIKTSKHSRKYTFDGGLDRDYIMQKRKAKEKENVRLECNQIGIKR